MHLNALLIAADLAALSTLESSGVTRSLSLKSFKTGARHANVGYAITKPHYE